MGQDNGNDMGGAGVVPVPRFGAPMQVSDTWARVWAYIISYPISSSALDNYYALLGRCA